MNLYNNYYALLCCKASRTASWKWRSMDKIIIIIIIIIIIAAANSWSRFYLFLIFCEQNSKMNKAMINDSVVTKNDGIG